MTLENCWAPFTNVDYISILQPINSFLCPQLKLVTRVPPKDTTRMFTAVLFKIAPHWKQCQYPSTGEYTLCCVHRMEYTLYDSSCIKSQTGKPDWWQQKPGKCLPLGYGNQKGVQWGALPLLWRKLKADPTSSTFYFFTHQTLFSWAPKSLQMVTAAKKLKDALSFKEKLWPT